ncbi:MAG: hypothetical protein ACK56I_12830, partial [bacterium]
MFEAKRLFRQGLDFKRIERNALNLMKKLARLIEIKTLLCLLKSSFTHMARNVSPECSNVLKKLLFRDGMPSRS